MALSYEDAPVNSTVLFPPLMGLVNKDLARTLQTKTCNLEAEPED